jgi:hypothetical protein
MRGVLDQAGGAGPVPSEGMMTGQAARAGAIRRMQAIYRKARELAEERGLAASYPRHRSAGLMIRQ